MAHCLENREVIRLSPIAAVFLVTLGVTLGLGGTGEALTLFTNPSVPLSTGTTRETCDVRVADDYAVGGAAISMTLRNRLELFNAEINASGQNTGQGKCIFGIYFLDPMTITLKEPLQIRAIQHLNNAGKAVGTYISGRRSPTAGGGPLSVVIDATDITRTPGRCAFMIDDGLVSLQQIHDVTIRVSDATRVICDSHGNNLMNQPIPTGTARNCPAGTLAKDCDFRGVTVPPPPPPSSSSPTCALTATPATGGGFDLAWISNGGTSATLKEGATTLPAIPLNSTTPQHVAPTTSTIYTLTVTGTGGSCSKTVTLSPTSPTPTVPTCTFSQPVLSGNDYQLTWTTTNATGGVTVKDGSGNVIVPNPDPNPASPTLFPAPSTPITITLTATGDAGTTCASSVTLLPLASTPTVPTTPPTCNLTSAVAGNSFDLTWSSTNGTTVSLSDGSSNLSTAPSSLTAIRVAPTAATTYTLSVTNSGGSCTKAIVLSPPAAAVVQPPPPAAPPASPPSQNPTTPPVSSENPAPAQNPSPSPSFSSSGPDTDGDGIPDDLEIHVFGTDPKNRDTDGDGLPDGEEVLSLLYPYCSPIDPDCDNDGICDGAGTVKDEKGNTLCAAFNGKGDNCPLVSNGPNSKIAPENIQRDGDGDGVGDACQGDADGDTIPDVKDNCPFVANQDQSDGNLNNIGDACDLSFSVAPTGGGCGCRMEGGRASQAELPVFLAFLIFPLVIFQIWRKTPFLTQLLGRSIDNP